MANLQAPGRIAQRESARFTRGRSLVQSQVRPSLKYLQRGLSAPSSLHSRVPSVGALQSSCKVAPNAEATRAPC